MNLEKLKKHVETLCKKNLKSPRIKCCVECPFEEEIKLNFPEMVPLFVERKLAAKKAAERKRKNDTSRRA